MLQRKSHKPKKRSAARWIRRGVLIVAALYACVAVLPYAFPPQSEPLPTDWIAQASSEENIDSATILETGEEALDVRLRLIAGAEASIRAGSYIYAMDDSGSQITAALLAAADRGVQVRLIIDGLIGLINLKNDPGAYALGSHPNVEIRFYNPVNLLDPVGLNARYHEKFFVIDDEWLILGGRNVADEFLSQSGNPKYNYDQDILLHNDRPGYGACRQVADYFDAMWDSGLCATRYAQAPGYQAQAVADARAALDALWQSMQAERELLAIDPAALVPVEKTVFICGDIAPRPKQALVYDKLIALMAQAQERVILQSPYFVMNAPMRDALAQVCSLPTDMVLLTNSAATGNNIMASADGVFHRAMMNSLDAQALELQGDYSMHTKSILIDRNISVFGSFNVDPRSAYIDTELMLAVYSPELAQLLEENMNTLLAQAAPVNDQAAAVWPEVTRKEGDFAKMAAIYLLSPFVSLFRFLA